MPPGKTDISGCAPAALIPRILIQLASITGVEFDHERARIAVQNAVRADTDPLAQLASAAAEMQLRVSPARLPLSKAIWQAHHDMPVVIWSAKDARWIVVTHAGWFKLRIADGDHPTHRVTITRSELARRLHLSGVHEEVELGVVQPERPAENLSVLAAAKENHHNGHHASISPARRFISLLTAEREDIWRLLIFSVFSGILYLAAPLAVDAVVSNLAFGGQSMPYLQALIVLSIALFACLTLQAIVTGAQFYLSDVIQRRIFVRTASDLAYRLPRVRAQALDEVHAPELVNRFMDVVTAQKSTSLLLLDGVNLVFASIIGMMMLALYHPMLLLFAAVLFSLIVLCIWLLGRGAVATSIEESRMKYDLVNWFEEIAHFPFLFKGPGGYSMAYDRANQLATDYVLARSRHFRVLMRQIAGLLTLQVFAAATLLVMGGYLVISQQITLGQLVASELIMSAIVASLAKLGKNLEAWYDAMAAMDKLGHIFDLEIENKDGEQTEKRVGGVEVCASNLGFGYSGGSVLFENLNFTIPANSSAAIVGPHGSGSSSLLDILFGLRQAQSGYVTLDGLDLRSWYLEGLRESVQLLRQNEIVDATVVENLRLGRTDIGMDEVRSALAAVELLPELLARPEGLNLRLKIGGAPLSSNQRTRLLLARALVQKPRLLLMDELLDSLDEKSFNTLTKAIFESGIAWTVVVTTRDQNVTRMCAHVVEMAPCRLTDGSQSGRLVSAQS